MKEVIIIEIVSSILQGIKRFIVDYFLYFIGGITLQKMVLFKFIIGHTTMHIMLSVKLKQILPLKNHLSFIQKRIASIILIGMAQSIDALTGIDAIHSVVVYYFIAMEGTYIINIAREMGLPIPEQISEGIKKLGNYQPNNNETAVPAKEADKDTYKTDNFNG